MRKQAKVWVLAGMISVLAGVIGIEYWMIHRETTANARRIDAQWASRMAAIRQARAEEEERRREWAEAYRGRFDDPARWEAVRAEEMATETADRGRAVAEVHIALSTNASTAQEAR